MTFSTAWFSTDHMGGRESLRQLPPECVADCSSQGDCYDICQHWVDRLSFDGPPWLFREYLKGFGAWDDSELCDHNENKIRVLWAWAGYVFDDPESYSFLYLQS